MSKCFQGEDVCVILFFSFFFDFSSFFSFFSLFSFICYIFLFPVPFKIKIHFSECLLKFLSKEILCFISLFIYFSEIFSFFSTFVPF